MKELLLLSHSPVFSFHENPKQQTSFPSTLKWFHLIYSDDFFHNFATKNIKSGFAYTHPLHKRFSMNLNKFNKPTTVTNETIARGRIPGNFIIKFNVLKTTFVFLFLHYVYIRTNFHFSLFMYIIDLQLA